MRDPAAGNLSRREPDSAPILDVLARRGTLQHQTAETGQSVAELLTTVLTTPRLAGMDPWHVDWSLLERLPRRHVGRGGAEGHP